jgi:hypothetical protein
MGPLLCQYVGLDVGCKCKLASVGAGTVHRRRLTPTAAASPQAMDGKNRKVKPRRRLCVDRSAWHTRRLGKRQAHKYSATYVTNGAFSPPPLSSARNKRASSEKQKTGWMVSPPPWLHMHCSALLCRGRCLYVHIAYSTLAANHLCCREIPIGAGLDSMHCTDAQLNHMKSSRLGKCD